MVHGAGLLLRHGFECAAFENESPDRSGYRVLLPVRQLACASQDFPFGFDYGLGGVAQLRAVFLLRQAYGVRVRQNIPRELFAGLRVADMALQRSLEVAGGEGGPVLRQELQHTGGVALLHGAAEIA
jgi:hypothetical protein